MKRIIFALALVTSIISGTVFSFAADLSSSIQVVAYYFHGDARCPTCHRMEQFSKEAIEDNFKDELVSGKLVFKTVNIDKKENRHFVDDYQLYTKSLVLSLVIEGKEVKSKNLAKIWEYAGNKEKFFEYVKTEVNEFLKGS